MGRWPHKGMQGRMLILNQTASMWLHQLGSWQNVLEQFLESKLLEVNQEQDHGIRCSWQEHAPSSDTGPKKIHWHGLIFRCDKDDSSVGSKWFSVATKNAEWVNAVFFVENANPNPNKYFPTFSYFQKGFGVSESIASVKPAASIGLKIASTSSCFRLALFLCSPISLLAQRLSEQ